MTYTERGRAALDAYLARVRSGLSDRGDVDVGDVVAGIREHVETELTLSGVEVATAEHVAEVLDRLGPAASLGDPSGGVEMPADLSVARGGAVGVLALAVVGVALAPTRLLLVAVALLAIAAVGARAILPAEGARAGVEVRLLRVFWRLAATAMALVLLFAPAGLVWGSAQIGGVLEGPLARLVDAGVGPRPPRYWAATVAVAGAVTGAWCMILGLGVRSFAVQIRHALGPARSLMPRRSAVALLGAGGSLILLSLLGMLII